jgi:hypothetical protein
MACRGLRRRGSTDLVLVGSRRLHPRPAFQPRLRHPTIRAPPPPPPEFGVQPPLPHLGAGARPPLTGLLALHPIVSTLYPFLI